MVEYGAKIAKKRSAVSFVQDLKVWNTHRKSHLLETSIQVAKSQLDASRKAADALTSLINSSVFSHSKDEINISSNLDSLFIEKKSETPSIVQDRNINSSPYLIEGLSQCVVGALKPKSLSNTKESVDIFSSEENQHSHLKLRSRDECFTAFNASHLDEDHFPSHQGALDAADDIVGFTPSNQECFFSEDTSDKDVMSTSMQSLIDGLMAWGEDEAKANLNWAIRQSIKQ